MNPALRQRLRAIGFLVSGIATGIIILYLVLNPAAFAGIHPTPLVLLLGLTMIIAFWQTIVLLR